MKVERLRDPIGSVEDLLTFVFRVYSGTGGRYPALEWVDRKPAPDDFAGFREVYRPFLEFRLREEFDEVFVLRSGEGIAGTVAVVFNVRGKGVWWVPPWLEGEGVGLVEFLMVDPALKGRGYGSLLLNTALNRLLSAGKEPYVITFPDLEAYGYYLRRGFVEVSEYGRFVVLRWPPNREGGTDPETH